MMDNADNDNDNELSAANISTSPTKSNSPDSKSSRNSSTVEDKMLETSNQISNLRSEISHLADKSFKLADKSFKLADKSFKLADKNAQQINDLIRYNQNELELRQAILSHFESLGLECLDFAERKFFRMDGSVAAEWDGVILLENNTVYLLEAKQQFDMNKHIEMILMKITKTMEVIHTEVPVLAKLSLKLRHQYFVVQQIKDCEFKIIIGSNNMDKAMRDEILNHTSGNFSVVFCNGSSFTVQINTSK